MHVPLGQSDRLADPVVEEESIWQTRKKVVLGGMRRSPRHCQSRADGAAQALPVRKIPFPRS